MVATVLNDDISMPAHWKAATPVLMIVGAICILVSLGLCYMAGTDENGPLVFKYFMHSYLANFIYCLTFCLGALFFVLITNVSRAAWCATIRRVSELLAVTVTLWSIMFVPIVAMVLLSDSSVLFPWNGPESGLPVEKLAYLNGTWFTIRAIIYFAVWAITASYYFARSREQDETGNAEISLRMQRYAGPAIMLFALSVNFAAFDWVMSIDPTWFSTMFGVYVFAASMMGFFALMITIFLGLQRNGRLLKYVNVEHYHDMSKFLFGFVFFWSYIAFSQFMLYWYANIPEETIWYLHRMSHGWENVGLLLIIGHFAFPMLLLLSRHVRRNRAAMGVWAFILLFMHWIDISYLIMPNSGAPTLMMWIGHAVCAVGMISMFLSLVLLRAGNTPLVAKRDPWIPDALSYHVM